MSDKEKCVGASTCGGCDPDCPANQQPPAPEPCPNPKCRKTPEVELSVHYPMHAVRCTHCGMMGPFMPTPAEAIEAWNSVALRCKERDFHARLHGTLSCEIDGLKLDIAGLRRERDEVIGELEMREQYAYDLRQENNALKDVERNILQENKSLNAEVEHKTSLISGLHAEIDALKQWVDRLKAELERYKNNYHRQQKLLAGCDTALLTLVERAEVAEERLLNLLARIHRDGGHYVGKHGIEKACEDADRLCAERVVALEEAEEREKHLRNAYNILYATLDRDTAAKALEEGI